MTPAETERMTAEDAEDAERTKRGSWEPQMDTDKHGLSAAVHNIYLPGP
jgi:hypothetical protein